MKIFFIGDQEFIRVGLICKVIMLKEEWDEDITNPEIVLDKIRALNINADLFSFIQRIPHTSPAFRYPMHWDNLAVLPITTYENWWVNQVCKQVRKNVRRAERKGVIVKRTEFNDELIKGIQEIYNETRIRQGKLNRHYGKTFEETKKVNITYIDRSDFIGAYLENELIGFIKLVYTKTRTFARTMGIEGKIKYRGIGYMHALIAKAVEICAEKNIPYLVYGKFIYGPKGPDSVTMFKIYNGFQKFDIPRYFVSLNKKGEILFKLGLYKRLNEMIPGFILRPALKIRKLLYEMVYWRDYKEYRNAVKDIDD